MVIQTSLYLFGIVLGGIQNHIVHEFAVLENLLSAYHRVVVDIDDGGLVGVLHGIVI